MKHPTPAPAHSSTRSDRWPPTPTRRAVLGGWGRRLVVERYSLDAAADKLGEVYAQALANQTGAGRRVGEAVRAASRRAAADIVPVTVKNQIKRVLR